MASPDVATPLLLRWQGWLSRLATGPLSHGLPAVGGIVLCLLMAGLPLLTRQGMALLLLSSALLWLLLALSTAPGRPGGIGGWLLALLAVAVVATGFSPVPAAALKGLLKLLSYVAVYGLMRAVLAASWNWWNRIVAALLGGGLLACVLALRQLYLPLDELARWADPDSVSAGTVRIYGTLGNPNLLAGYLIPIVPLACVAALRWRSPWQRLYAATTAILSVLAVVMTYSRGGWLGLVAALAGLLLLLALRATRHWPPARRRLVPLALLVGGAAVLALLVSQLEPLRVRVMSLLAGRDDSSNNFRINVWLAALAMVRDRPWIGIGPGNDAFNLIYPLYQQPRFNALSAYSVPLELLVEGGVPMLLAGLGLLVSSLRRGLARLGGPAVTALPCIGALASIAGLAVHGLGDTIFFRPEVQLVGWFALATVAAAPAES